MKRLLSSRMAIFLLLAAPLLLAKSEQGLASPDSPFKLCRSGAIDSELSEADQMKFATKMVQSVRYDLRANRIITNRLLACLLPDKEREAWFRTEEPKLVAFLPWGERFQVKCDIEIQNLRDAIAKNYSLMKRYLAMSSVGDPYESSGQVSDSMNLAYPFPLNLYYDKSRDRFVNGHTGQVYFRGNLDLLLQTRPVHPYRGLVSPPPLDPDEILLALSEMNEDATDIAADYRGVKLPDRNDPNRKRIQELFWQNFLRAFQNTETETETEMESNKKPGNSDAPFAFSLASSDDLERADYIAYNNYRFSGYTEHSGWIKWLNEKASQVFIPPAFTKSTIIGKRYEYKQRYEQLLTDVPLMGFVATPNPSDAELVEALQTMQENPDIALADIEESFYNESLHVDPSKISLDAVQYLIKNKASINRIFNDINNRQYCQLADQLYHWQMSMETNTTLAFAGGGLVAMGACAVFLKKIPIARNLCLMLTSSFANGYLIIHMEQERSAAFEKIFAGPYGLSALDEIDELNSLQLQELLTFVLLPVEGLVAYKPIKSLWEALSPKVSAFIKKHMPDL